MHLHVLCVYLSPVQERKDPKQTCAFTDPIHHQPTNQSKDQPSSNYDQLEAEGVQLRFTEPADPCQDKWIQFNMARYNMFFVFVKRRKGRRSGGRVVWVLSRGIWWWVGGRRRRGYLKEQETKREHLTHMISIKAFATCQSLSRGGQGQALPTA